MSSFKNILIINENDIHQILLNSSSEIRLKVKVCTSCLQKPLISLTNSVGCSLIFSKSQFKIEFMEKILFLTQTFGIFSLFLN